MSISTKTRDRLWSVFAQVDKSGDHLIEWHEVKTCYEQLQIDVTEADYNIFKSSDTSGDGRLSFEEFCDFAKLRLEHVFQEIDHNGNGELDISEVQEVCNKMSINVSERQIMAILKSMDRNNDQKVDFNEFCDFFFDIPAPSVQAITQRWLTGVGLDVGTDMVPTVMPPPAQPLYMFMMAGGFAGVASRTVTAPLETVKIMSQTSATGRIPVGRTLLSIVRNDGFRGLFKGNLVNCLRIFPTSATVCLVYSQMIKHTPVDNEKNPQQPLWRLFSGATAGFVATTLTHPLDVVRAKLTVQESGVKRQYVGIYNSLVRIHVEEGYRGLWKGLSPTLLSLVPFMAVQQCSFDLLKMVALQNPDIGATPLNFLGFAALSGTLAQVCIHPLDVVRRQWQVSREISEGSQSTWYSLKRLYAIGGAGRLYAGIVPALLKVVPAASVSLICRDAILGRIKLVFDK